jgi:hypothetical protein
MLPAEYKDLEIYCDHIPFKADPVTRPFAGVVLNFCVSTRGHRDFIDKWICVVIPFGEWEGGDICFYELGLVIDLKPGHILIFRSSEITHFNLHFTGKRGSLVLHSDQQSKRWVDTRNGWENHVM